MARILVVDDSATVRRVVERTLERAGYVVTTAADGREALEQAQREMPDLILLDFVMPHMNGFQFCQSLRAVANLRDVPVVLMSAKADRIAEQFISQTGAVDAISKPFGPEAILAVTTNALGSRSTSSGARRAPAMRTSDAAAGTTAVDLAAPAPPPVAPSDEVTTPSVPPSGEETAQLTDPDAERFDAAVRSAERIATTVGPIVRRLGSQTADGDLARAIIDDLDPEDLFDLARDLARLLPGAPGEASFRGRIEHVALGEILQLLQHEHQTGVLEVRRDDDERSVSICVRDGLVDIALGRGGDHDLRLGRFLLEEELVEREDLELLLKQRGGSKRLLGAQLVKRGYIGQDDLRHVLVRQTSELVYESLRWHTGAFVFDRYATRPEATDARLGLPVASILMEGLRRVDEWRLIEEQIRSFDMVLAVRMDAVSALTEGALSREEHQILHAIDGERTVRDIVEHTRMPSFDACKILFQLMTSGLVHAPG